MESTLAPDLAGHATSCFPHLCMQFLLQFCIYSPASNEYTLEFPILPSRFAPEAVTDACAMGKSGLLTQ